MITHTFKTTSIKNDIAIQIVTFMINSFKNEEYTVFFSPNAYEKFKTMNVNITVYNIEAAMALKTAYGEYFVEKSK